MCGRYTLFGNWKSKLPPGTIPDEFNEFQDEIDNYNVSPLQTMPIITKDDSHLHLRAMEWGLIPSWAKDASLASSMINARSETIQEKPSFKQAFRKRRCLVPMSGFYEWASSTTKKKQPVYCNYSDEELMLAAGIWEDWVDPHNQCKHHTFTIITVPANRVLERFHERMPAFIDQGHMNDWLYDDEKAVHLLKTLPDKKLATHFVSQLVNNSSTNGPELIEECQPIIDESSIVATKPPGKSKKGLLPKNHSNQEGLF